VLIVAASFLLAASVAGAAAPTKPSDAAVTVLDLRVVRRDGTIVPLHDVTESAPTIVAFWASYCAPCRAEVPALNRAIDRWRSDGVRVLGVAVETDGGRVREAHDAWGMRYEALHLAPGEEAAVERLLPRGLPTTAFVAHGGLLLYQHFVDDEALDRLVPPLLHGGAKTR